MADAEFGTLWTEFVQSRKGNLPSQIDLLKLLETEHCGPVQAPCDIRERAACARHCARANQVHLSAI